MAAEVPPLRSRPVATMKDMGMDMSGMDMSGASGGTIDLSKPDGGMVGMDHGAMGHDMAAGAAGAVAGMAPQAGDGMRSEERQGGKELVSKWRSRVAA